MKSILKITLAVLAVLGLFLLLSFCLFNLSKSRTFQLFGSLTNRVDTAEKVVALTFDDGPTPHTEAVLQILQQKGIPTTFYVIGQELEKQPQLGRRIVEQGHELGNHSYTHPRFLLKSLSFVKQEIDSTNQLIRVTGYTGPITFRPPYGKKLFTLPWYLKQQHIQTITWDVEPDTFGTNTEFLVDYTIDHVRPGSIILLHPFCDNCESDRQAIPLIIDQLQQAGYSFVTISQLLTYQK